MKKLVFFVLALTFMLSAYGALAEAPVKGGSLIVCKSAEPPGLDPTANTAAAIDRVVWCNLFETLV